MRRLRIFLVLAGLLASGGVTRAQGFKERFIGKTPCSPDLQTEHSDLSFRLDKTKDGPPCGVVRDVVQITRIVKEKHFEFRCFDPKAPTDVVVGTIIREYGNTKLMTAIDAWRIDLSQQKFVETHQKVVCSADGFAGEDDGGDLVNEAKKYATHGKPGQFD